MSAELAPSGEALADEELERWRQLAIDRENPFLTPEWQAAWAEAYPDERPFVVLWRPGGELRGVLPLVVSARSGLRSLRFAGARRGDWFTPACAPEDETEMARDCAELLSRQRGPWQLLRLDRVDRDSAWPAALWGAPGSPFARARPRRADTLPFIQFDRDGYEGYLAGRSRNFRSQLNRRRRKLEREHGLRFRLVEDAADFDRDFDLFLDLHEERWRERGGSSSSAPRAQLFQRRFAAAALERGWLRLWIAEADDEAAAAWYGWRIGGRYCYALSGFRERYERLSLGTVVLAHTIERAAAEGATIYDLMWGEESYKARFATDQRETATWVLGRRRSPVALGASLRTRVERGARRVAGR